MFPANGDGVYMVVDEKGEFREDNFHRAITALEKGVGDQKLEVRRGHPQGSAEQAARPSPLPPSPPY